MSTHDTRTRTSEASTPTGTASDTTAPAMDALLPILNLEQQYALRVAAVRLTEEFTGTFNAETIERFLTTSYDEFVGKATLVNFLPLLAERFARQRLRALARLEGHHDDGRPVVLFLCVHNAGRSQMALGFFDHYAGPDAVGWSGGSKPAEQVSDVAVAAMAEKGIDIRNAFPKPWTDEVVRAADAVITMGCGDACPIFPGKRYEEWPLPDPASWTLEEVRPVRDAIEQRVLTLLSELEVEPRVPTS
ncbi:arsenate reductase ArsC [Nocardioides sp. 1609]|uniref:arsenate reductase ArsC n=1 Tax=Nocardioides sp. 1609 TaxID=2508327 RepID=UPI001FD6A52C|nr:arsenate reductase ArsC [Nocardioides sp. 1609]